MNDRQQPLSMPKFQAGFISAIVLPLYETLARVPVLTSALEGTFYHTVYHVLIYSSHTHPRSQTRLKHLEAPPSQNERSCRMQVLATPP